MDNYERIDGVDDVQKLGVTSYEFATAVYQALVEYRDGL